MFLATIELDYTTQQKFNNREISREQWDKISAAIPDLKLPDYDDEKACKGWWMHDKIVVDEDTVQLLTDCDLGVTLRRVKGVKYNMPEQAPITSTTTLVSVGNVGLFAVNKVTWLENACTEDVQNMLDEGWRILAVCPPNDTRRPDYIFGKIDNES